MQLAVLFLLTMLYVVAGRFGLSLAFHNARASAVWPPTGLALAATILLGYRVWPAIFVGAFLVNFTTPSSTRDLSAAMVSLAIAGGNTLEALTGAFLAQQFASGKAAFSRVASVVRYLLLAALPSTIVSASIGLATLMTAGLPASNAPFTVWLTWWTGDFVSDILICPLLISLAVGGYKIQNRRRIMEALLLTLVIIITSQVIFGIGGSWGFLSRRPYALASLATPLLIWSAFRFRQRGALGAAFILSAVAIQGTLQGTGPFAIADRNDSLILLQCFMGINTLTALVLAAVVTERNRADSEKLKLLQSERAARTEAELANRAKDEFLAILSHELRTPLTPVMLTASMLERDPDLPARLRADIHQIRHNVELEARLIDDLLDLTRVAHGKLQLAVQTTDLHQKLSYAADIFSARKSDITLHLNAASHHVHGDPARLQQIFWNLLSNAVKFTPRGNPITATTSNPTPDTIQIQVSDRGVGIDPAFLPKLFQAFQQGHPAQARSTGGLGLGLSITRALVIAHHGEIACTSAGSNQGATFTVTLHTVPAPIESPHAAPHAPPIPTSLQVLLVEDHEPTIAVMTRLLKNLGHRVTSAATVKEALHAEKLSPPDLIISDIGLPDASGYDLLRKINSHRAHPIKAIAVSGYGMDHDLELSRKAGFAAHLTKPIDLEKLEAAILRATDPSPPPFPILNSPPIPPSPAQSPSAAFRN